VQPSFDQRQFLGVLDGVERLLVFIYRLLLALIIAAVLVITAIVVIKKPWGAGNQGEWFYFGLGVLLVLAVTVSKFIALGRRRAGPDFPIQFLSTQQEAGRIFELRIGSGDVAHDAGAAPASGQFSLSRSFEVPLASLPAAVLPDERRG
jgi:hypothetical protein